MGRLIDAGLFLDNLSGRLESMKDYDAVKDVINNMPTTYNLDKVVKQLEEERENVGFVKATTEASAYILGINDAIKIVKGGGVDAF